jgi:putative ABC transport system substrate-binding protein
MTPRQVRSPDISQLANAILYSAIRPWLGGHRMQFDRLKRREFIAALGGAAVMRPVMAWAQQRERMRRIGVLMTLAAGAPEGQSRLTAFAQGLQELGWSEGRNISIEYRWAAGNPELAQKYAAELVGLAPDVILAGGTPSVVPLGK